jgi:hypothetical protein
MAARAERALGALLRGIVCSVAAATAGCEGGGAGSDAGVFDERACAATHRVTQGDADCPSEQTSFPCGLPPELVDAGAGKVLDLKVCDRHCTITSTKGGTYCYPRPVGGRTVLQCEIQCIGGRRPEGYRAPAGGAGVGGWFARLASLEHASVAAFERLAGELEAHAAPADLIDNARRAAGDERRHTAMAAGLARRWGAVPVLATTARATVRPLREVAEENAVEGCVREAYGALLATWQAAHARDERVSATMGAIAADEARHAALAWAVHAWVTERLDERARDEVDAAMADAWAELRAAVAQADGALVAAAGMPTAAQQIGLLAALEDSRFDTSRRRSPIGHVWKGKGWRSRRAARTFSRRTRAGRRSPGAGRRGRARRRRGRSWRR